MAQDSEREVAILSEPTASTQDSLSMKTLCSMMQHQDKQQEEKNRKKKENKDVEKGTLSRYIVKPHIQLLSTQEKKHIPEDLFTQSTRITQHF